MGVPPNGWFYKGKFHLEMDELGVRQFQETSISCNLQLHKLSSHKFSSIKIAKTVNNSYNMVQLQKFRSWSSSASNCCGHFRGIFTGRSGRIPRLLLSLHHRSFASTGQFARGDFQVHTDLVKVSGILRRMEHPTGHQAARKLKGS